MASLKLLLKIFGIGVYDLTDGELSVAHKVADYFDNSSEGVIKVLTSEQKLIDACRYALEKEGTNWESVMLNRTRKKEVVYQ